MDAKHILKIDWRGDTHDCDTCGTSHALGALVTLDGEAIVDVTPVAHCYAGTSDVELVGILLIALQKLGVQVIDGENDLDWWMNSCKQ